MSVAGDGVSGRERRWIWPSWVGETLDRRDPAVDGSLDLPGRRETLIDETRLWSIWADELGVPLMTFMSAFGAAVAPRPASTTTCSRSSAVPAWREHIPGVQQRYGGFQPVDLYPDALSSLAACASWATGSRSRPTSRPSARPS